ncbi:hypothetical protein AAMO2058_000537800 [Amorphochlora amoebiformis]
MAEAPRKSKRGNVHAGVPYRIHSLFFNHSSSKSPKKSQKIGRFTLQMVHHNPNVYVIDDFLTDREIRHLGNVCERSNFERSYTDTPDGRKILSHFRTSTFLWLGKQQDCFVRSIESRAAMIVGYPETNVEPFQMVRYSTGQSFKAHHDMGPIIDGKGIQAIPPRRIITYFVYLNTPPRGQGCTEFPLINTQVCPKRGRALLFCNIDSKGEPNPAVIHRAQPVGLGVVKYGLNIWVSEKSMQGFAAFGGTTKFKVSKEDKHGIGMFDTQKETQPNSSSATGLSLLTTLSAMTKWQF